MSISIFYFGLKSWNKFIIYESILTIKIPLFTDLKKKSIKAIKASEEVLIQT